MKAGENISKLNLSQMDDDQPAFTTSCAVKAACLAHGSRAAKSMQTGVEIVML
jgi:hypothetical protein